MDTKPNFTNNYVNFNRPETFAAQWNKPVEAASPQKQPQPEVVAPLPKKAEYVETDNELVRISKFDENKAVQAPGPKAQVIQVVKQEPITKVITQPKMEKFDYKYIGSSSAKKAVVNKAAEPPRALLAQRNSEAKVAVAKIELREEPTAALKQVEEKNEEEGALGSVIEIEKTRIT